MIEYDIIVEMRLYSMSMEEFLLNCTACGGNWGAMLLTGIKRVFPEYYTEVEEHYNSMDFSICGR